ncbi:MAG: cation transporter [Bacteroidia bacterium]|nr:cation transporter [Bacteroidia bacterium]
MLQHNHNHDDELHSHHAEPLTNINTAFVYGILLNFLFVIIEVIAGLYVNSLSLLSDAGHNLADVAALSLSLLAFRLAKAKPNEQYTYGYSKTTILVALLNAMVLLVSIGAIAYEAVHRFLHPEPLPGKMIAMVAGVGIIINSVTAMLFFREKEKDLNVKSAYLHLLSDAMVSLAIVIGGIIMFYTNYFWIDAALSMIIVIVILITTWNLLRSSLRLSMDAVPENITIEKVKAEAEKVEGVKNIHHIHLWAISTTRNALTAHVVVDKNKSLLQIENIKHQVKHTFERLNIHHATLEIEPDDGSCDDEVH